MRIMPTNGCITVPLQNACNVLSCLPACECVSEHPNSRMQRLIRILFLWPGTTIGDDDDYNVRNIGLGYTLNTYLTTTAIKCIYWRWIWSYWVMFIDARSPSRSLLHKRLPHSFGCLATKRGPYVVFIFRHPENRNLYQLYRHFCVFVSVCVCLCVQWSFFGFHLLLLFSN